MSCTWYAGDVFTAAGPLDYVAYPSFSEALAATTGFTEPDVIWGDLAAGVNLDGSGIFVSIYFINLPGTLWSYSIGVVGNANVDSQLNFGSAAAALAAAQQSPNLPQGFCVADSCDPNVLMDAAKCFRCIPSGMQREVQIYLLCQIANL